MQAKIWVSGKTPTQAPHLPNLSWRIAIARPQKSGESFDTRKAIFENRGPVNFHRPCRCHNFMLYHTHKRCGFQKMTIKSDIVIVIVTSICVDMQ